MEDARAIPNTSTAPNSLVSVRTTWAESPWLRLLRATVKVLGTLLIVCGLALLTAVALLWYYQKSANDQVQQIWLSQRHNDESLLSSLPAVPTITPAPNSHHGLAPTPVPTYLPAIHIKIPSINVDAQVIEVGVVMGRWQVAAYAVGHSQGTANPGQPGNMVMAAHDDIQGELFRYLGKVKPGDPIIVYTAKGQYVYIAQSTPIVPPTDVAVMDPTSDTRLTLITCTPYWVDTMRQLVIAKLYQDPTTTASSTASSPQTIIAN